MVINETTHVLPFFFIAKTHVLPCINKFSAIDQ